MSVRKNPVYWTNFPLKKIISPAWNNNKVSLNPTKVWHCCSAYNEPALEYFVPFVYLSGLLTIIIIVVAPVTSTLPSLPVVTIHPENSDAETRFAEPKWTLVEKNQNREDIHAKPSELGEISGLGEVWGDDVELRGNTRAPATPTDRWMTRGKLNGNQQPFRTGPQLKAWKKRKLRKEEFPLVNGKGSKTHVNDRANMRSWGEAGRCLLLDAPSCPMSVFGVKSLNCCFLHASVN